MFGASPMVLLRRNKKGKDNKEEEEENWEVDSDELNESFDSDDEGAEETSFMQINKNRASMLLGGSYAMGGGMGTPQPKSMVSLQERSKKPKKKARFKKQGRKFKHEVDTNVISLDLKVLKEDALLAAGDPIFCESCDAVFNMHSKLENQLEEIKEEANEDEDMNEEQKHEGDVEMKEDLKMPGEGEHIWMCEFCNHRNIVAIEQEEVPTKDAINYIIDTEEAADNKKHTGESAVIFCVDISGSMCVTKPVEGKFKIKGDKYEDLQQLMKFSDGSDQFAFNDRNVTYVSRLQCVQAAIEAQLIDMKAEKSKRKVGLVSFNGEVNIIGDGSQVSQTISGDKLTDYKYLIENGEKVAKTHMEQGIDDTESQLNEKLFALEESGPTALGPAVVSAIAMAGQSGIGSSVVICTDGLANVGVGSLEEQKDGSDAQADVATFYEQLADYAYQKGVTVNIISIKGEECDLETLSPLYDKTGGNVDIIEPDELKNNFANMLKAETIATRVVTKIKLHKALEFRNEDAANLKSENTLLTRDMGNVTEDSEITFEYRVKDQEQLEKLKDFDINKLESIPFQTIIEYTKLNGLKCMRTITMVQQVTDSAEEARKNVRLDVLAVNAAQQTSKFANRGEFREAQAYSINQKRMLKNNISSPEDMYMFKNWRGQMNEMYSDMHEQNNMEEMANDNHLSAPGTVGKIGSSRKTKMNDRASKNVHHAKTFNKMSLK